MQTLLSNSLKVWCAGTCSYQVQDLALFVFEKLELGVEFAKSKFTLRNTVHRDRRSIVDCHHWLQVLQTKLEDPAVVNNIISDVLLERLQQEFNDWGSVPMMILEEKFDQFCAIQVDADFSKFASTITQI